MKILFSLLLIAVIVSLGGLAVAKDTDERANPFKDPVLAFEDEPNDDCANANVLAVDDPMLAAIDPETDHDWFEFTANAGQCVSFETFPGEGQDGGDTRMWLWDSDCVTQVDFNDDGGDGQNSLITYALTQGETYFIRLNEYQDNGTGAYSLVITGCGDAPCGNDPGNDTLADFTHIADCGTTSAAIDCAGDLDY